MQFDLISYDAPLNDAQKRIMNKGYRENLWQKGFGYTKEGQLANHDPFWIKNKSDGGDVLSGAVSTVALNVGITAKITAVHCGIAASGALAGAAAGVSLAIMEGIVICVNIHRIRHSPEYLDWKKRREKIMTDQSIIEFLRKDEVMRYLFCPISNTLPKLSSRDQSDITYDYKSARKWMKTHPGEALPKSKIITNSKKELRFDYAHLNSIIARLDRLVPWTTDEKTKRVCQLLGAKQDSEELANMFFIFNLCESHTNITFTQFFAGTNESVKKSFLQMEKINDVCINKSAFYSRMRYRDFEDYKQQTEKKMAKIVAEQDLTAIGNFLAHVRGEAMTMCTIKVIKKLHLDPVKAFFWKNFGWSRPVLVTRESADNVYDNFFAT